MPLVNCGPLVSLRLRGSPLSLANTKNSMDQFSNRTHERCITLSRPYSLSPDGFTSLHLPLGVLFSFHSRYYCTIGLGECLGLGVCATRIHARFPTHATPCTGTHPRLTTTGLSPSAVPRSRGLRVTTVGCTRAPHLHALSCTDSVCPVPLSIAFTHGIAIAFFSSAY